MKFRKITRKNTYLNLYCIYCHKCTLEKEYYQSPNFVRLHTDCYKLYQEKNQPISKITKN